MTAEPSPPFGTLLRRYRREAGLTQEELAERARLSVRAISDLERGVNHTPRVETVDLLGDALHLVPEARAALESTIRRRRGPAARQEQPALPMPAPLPVPPTPLVGREHEEAAVVHLLRHGQPGGAQVRLLSLIGPGGIGKTRLALQVATSLVQQFEGRVAFVPLAAVGEAALVAHTIAGALGVREEGHGVLAQSLAARLRDVSHLLVLDTFEHLLGAASLVADLLAACPLLTVLATSRAPLRVRGEHEFAVPPLAVPAAGTAPTPGELLRYPSVVVFVQRAQAVSAGFTLGEVNAAAVAAICRRLDGLPLAIELAAARVRLLPPPALLPRLDRSLALLTDGPRDLPPHQRTLRATLAWSHDLLGAEEQVLFRRLAVFAGSCTLDAVAAVVAPAGAAPDAMEGVAALAGQSLLRMGATDQQEPRLTMLETVREYALERLAAAGEAACLRQAHAAHYLALAVEAAPRLQGPEQAAWLGRLEQEHDNLRAALAWACEADGASADERRVRCALGLRLASALAGFWNVRGHDGEGRRWLETLLAGKAAEGDLALRARALSAASNLAQAQADFPRAEALLEESLPLWHALGDTGGLAAALNGLGNMARQHSDYVRAIALLEESLALCREVGDSRGTARSLGNLSSAVREQGDYARAEALLHEALGLFRALGDRRYIAVNLNNLGLVAEDQGDYARAAAYYEESLAQYRVLGYRHGVATALCNLGLMRGHSGDYRAAQAFLEEGIALYKDLGDTRSLAMALGTLGWVCRGLGEHAVAGRFYAESLTLLHAVGDRKRLADCLDGVASLARDVGEPYRAACLFAAAAYLRESIGAALPPREQLNRDADVAAVRTTLGDEATAAAWAEGQRLDAEQAVAFALAVLPAGSPGEPATTLAAARPTT